MFGYEFAKNLRNRFNTLMPFSRNANESQEDLDNNSDKEIDEENGFVFSVKKTSKTKEDYYLPEEILALVLSYVNVDDLLNCRLVCQSWKVIIESLVFRNKTERECASRLKKGVYKKGKSYPILPWKVYFSILKYDVFGRNLLKNNCGQDNFQHWKRLANGGNGFIIEQNPVGSDPLPDDEDFNGYKSCFVTSFHLCAKVQLIDLVAEGLIPEILDKYQPTIVVSEWFASRFDCGCIYELNVELLDKDQRQRRECFERREIQQWEGRDWRKISHTFNDYGPGVRYVIFRHTGSDSMYWAGHYGCKIAGGTVKVFYSSL